MKIRLIGGSILFLSTLVLGLWVFGCSMAPGVGVFGAKYMEYAYLRLINQADGKQLEDTNYSFGTVGNVGLVNKQLDVEVYNGKDRPTGLLTVTIGGDDPKAFVIDNAVINNVGAKASGGFTITPAQKQKPGNYKAAVTVSGGYQFADHSFEVGVTVFGGYVGAVGVNWGSNGLGGFATPFRWYWIDDDCFIDGPSTIDGKTVTSYSWSIAGFLITANTKDFTFDGSTYASGSYNVSLTAITSDGSFTGNVVIPYGINSP